MIQTFLELRNFLEKQAEEFDDPLFKKGFIISEPGSSKEQIEFLKKEIPSLPDSYIEWIKKYNFHGISIGYFTLSPFSNHPLGMVENLIDAYNNPFFPQQFMQEYKLYQIGFCNTDLVCITGKSEKFNEGTIVYVDEGYDIFNPSREQIFPLTNDFETFLLVAGNLTQLRVEVNYERLTYSEALEKFRNYLVYFKIPLQYHKKWLSLV